MSMVIAPGGSSHADIVFPEGECAVRKQIPFFHHASSSKKATDFLSYGMLSLFFTFSFYRLHDKYTL